MKRVKVFIALICVLALSSCGYTKTAMTHGNTALTNVELSQKNFVVVGQAEGVATNSYVLGFGGLGKRLYSQAKNDMIQNAKLKGKARAIVDITYDKHVAHYVFFQVYTVTATGTVIEFTK
ncbi:MAG: hypothetical protein LBQ78_08375 [Tannerellaceae bacterium]|jgi:hypothetical protein|nr:hypothetical protein [Tannerellaceae bacterium]